MLDRNDFMETLREVAEIVRTAPEPPAKEEILSYFKDMELNSAQKDMVFEYLITPQEEKTDSEDIREETGKDIQDETDEEHPKALEMYFSDLEAIPEYTNEELQGMYDELLNGNKEVINSISDAMLKSVAVLADEYASEKVEPLDLIQEGNLALFVRLNELCGMGADCGYDVEDEIGEAVNEAMKLYVSEVTGEENSENTVAGKANLVRKSQKYLHAQKGRMPTVDELSRYTGLSDNELADILNMIDKADKK